MDAARAAVTRESDLLVERLGQAAGFSTVSLMRVAAVAIVWLFMPETKSTATE